MPRVRVTLSTIDIDWLDLVEVVHAKVDVDISSWPVV